MYGRIKTDKVIAMKAKNKPEVAVYKYLQAMIYNKVKDELVKNKEATATDELIIPLMDKYYYEMKYVLDEYKKEIDIKPTDNLLELISNTELTIRIYDKYLPTKEDVEVTKAKIIQMNEDMSNIENTKRRGGMIRGKLKKDQFTTDMYWVGKNIDLLVK